MKRLLHTWLIVLSFITACSDNPQKDNTYHELNNIIAESPQLAYDSICGLLNGKFLPEEQKCSLLLLKEKAKYKAYMNVTDSDAIILEEVNRYYSRKKNREMMVESYFLLGYVLNCIHDTPSALEALLNATKTAEDIQGYDNPTMMMRVYMEIQNIYYNLRLYDLFHTANQQVIKYAEECHDTTFLAYCHEVNNAVFYLQEKFDSVIAGYPKVRYYYESTGNTARAAQSLSQYIMANIMLGRIDTAKSCLIELEKEGMIFDENHEVLPKYSLYYYMKGMICMQENESDSAAYYFHKELANIPADDINNRRGALSGLMNLYDKTGQVDSAYKYTRALMGVKVTDYDKEVSEKLTEMQSLYDYSRHQAIAKERLYENETLKRRNETLFFIVLSVVILFIAIGYIITLRVKAMKREQLAKEEELRIKLDEYKRSQAINEHRIEEYQKNLQESYIIGLIYELEDENKKIDGYTLSAILCYGKSHYPLFFGTMIEQFGISDNEAIVFVMRKLNFRPSEISKVLSMSQSNVNNIIVRLFKKVNGKTVNTSQALEWIDKLE